MAEPEGTFAGTQVDNPDDEFGFLQPVERKPIEDPTMDPGKPQWNPKKYFDAQPKYIVVIRRNESDILGDPSGKKPIFCDVGINGYFIKVQKDVPTRVPRDFALQILDAGAGTIVSEIPEA